MDDFKEEKEMRKEMRRMVTIILGVVVFIVIMVYLNRPISDVSEINKNESQDVKHIEKEALKKLLIRINRNGNINDLSTPRPLVTLEEFFEGNDDYGSIGYNFYPDQPAPSEFYSLFKSILVKPEVADIRVEVKDLEDPEGWPSTDTVWIITKASVNDVEKWLGQRFRADDFIIGFPEQYKCEHYDIPEQMKAIGVWWD